MLVGRIIGNYWGGIGRGDGCEGKRMGGGRYKGVLTSLMGTLGQILVWMMVTRSHGGGF